MITFKRACARCLSKYLRTSRVRRTDWVLMGVGFSPVRCAACSTRMYLHRTVDGGLPREIPAWEVQRRTRLSVL